jgi:hypothetical protein
LFIGILDAVLTIDNMVWQRPKRSSIIFERFDMNKRSLTSLVATSLQKISGLGLTALVAIAFASITPLAEAAPHRSYGGGLSSHSSVSINVGSRGHGGHYRGGHNYYGGYGWGGHGYRSYGWGGWNGWGGLYTGLALGLTVPLLANGYSNGYSSSWYGGSPYYYADDSYYVSYPQREYRVLSPTERVITERYVYESPSPAPVVAAPPMSGAPTPSYVRESSPTSAPTPAPTSPPTSSPTQSKAPAQTLPQLYAYPKNGQTATQSTFDRIECERWGSGQTGYSPGQSVEDGNRKADYQRAVSACLEGRGYTVR